LPTGTVPNYFTNGFAWNLCCRAKQTEANRAKTAAQAHKKTVIDKQTALETFSRKSDDVVRAAVTAIKIPSVTFGQRLLILWTRERLIPFSRVLLVTSPPELLASERGNASILLGHVLG
jgi:hypothetical protein